MASSCERAGNLSLLAGYLALLSGDAPAAFLQLNAVAAPPALEPFRVFYLGEALYQSQRYAEAAEAFERVVSANPNTLVAKAQARLGLSLAKAGVYDKSLHHLDIAIRAQPSAELLWARAAALQSIGQVERASGDWHYLTVHFATDPRAAEAAAALKGHLGFAFPLTPEERLRRARAFSDAGQWQTTLGELASIPAAPRRSPLYTKIALARARAQYGLGNEAEAEREIKRTSDGPPALAAEAFLLRAKRTLRGDDTAKARAQMVQIDKKFQSQPQADEAGFLIGWLDLQAGRFAEAVKSFTTFAQRHPRSSRLDEGQWLESLAMIRLKRWGSARASLNNLVSRFPRSHLVPQARYWLVRIDQLSDRAAGDVVDAYREMVRTFPGTFYAFLSQARLWEMGEEAPLSFSPLMVDAKPSIPPRLELAALLESTGLLRDSADEIHRVTALIRQPEDAVSFGLALHDLEEYGHAYALAVRLLWGAAYTAKESVPLLLLFPRAYQPIVEQEAKVRGLSPFFIWSIMRRESSFLSDSSSTANARGLLQLVPRTAAAIAKKLSEPTPSPDQLFSPEVNIHLGSWYLGDLYRRFGHPVTAAAAYNAGPGPVLRWLEANSKMPLDLFVESIPYRETRAYVKQVCGDLANYYALYGKTTATPTISLALPKADERGLEF